MRYILTAEGKIEHNAGTFAYQYFHKDHLGNTRVTYKQNGEIVQTADYYPFGLRHEPMALEDASQKYLYNGKELQPELGWLDYGARMYDASLSMFMTLDPLAEKYAFQTPFAYAANNPIRFVDWNGMGPVPGPFTGRVYTANVGVRAFRFTPEQRRVMNICDQAFYAGTGAIGMVAGISDGISNARHNTSWETAYTVVTPPMGKALEKGLDSFADAYYNADYVSSPSKSAVKFGLNFKTFAKVSGGLLKGFGYTGVAVAAMDKAPTRQEILEGATFTLATGLMGGEISLVNDGIITFYGEENTDVITNGLNSIYTALDTLLQDYDLETEEGRNDAFSYINDNYKTIASLIYFIYNSNNDNETENNND